MIAARAGKAHAAAGVVAQSTPDAHTIPCPMRTHGAEHGVCSPHIAPHLLLNNSSRQVVVIEQLRLQAVGGGRLCSGDYELRLSLHQVALTPPPIPPLAAPGGWLSRLLRLSLL